MNTRILVISLHGRQRAERFPREILVATLEAQLRLLAARAAAGLPLDPRSVNNLVRLIRYAVELEVISQEFQAFFYSSFLSFFIGERGWWRAG